MTLRLRAVLIAFVAAPATLLGHGLTYAMGAVSLADGRHTYFLPALQVLVTLALGTALVLIVRSLISRPDLRMSPAPCESELVEGLRLWAVFSFAQCALFVSLEALEGYRASLLGCAIQCAVAFIAALLVLWFEDVLQRCEEISLAFGIYLPRTRQGPRLLPHRSLCPVPVSRLNERRGVRRFQRPPPGL